MRFDTLETFSLKNAHLGLMSFQVVALGDYLALVVCSHSRNFAAGGLFDSFAGGLFDSFGWGFYDSFAEGFFHSFAENLSFVGYDRSCRGQISW